MRTTTHPSSPSRLQPSQRALLPLQLADLEEPARVAEFRAALARRGVDLPVFHVYDPSPLSCEPCFKAAAEAVGWTREKQEPLPEERGVLDAYTRLAWYFDRAEEREGPLEDFDFEEDRQAAGREARFRADSARGLYRLTLPEAGRDEVWIWLYQHDSSGIEALVAVRERSLLRPFLSAIHRLDVDHDRRHTGVILIGNYGESRNALTRVGWEEIVLPTGLREEIRQTVEEFFASGELYRRHNIPHRRGILLAGPPGNGKTSLLKAIGSTVGLPVIVATIDSAQEGHNARNAFTRASHLAPCILCFEDLDALIGEGPGLSQFLNLLDGLEPLEGVLVVATTNRPDRIDAAIAKRPSRFDRVFVVPDPDREQREAYLRRVLGDDVAPTEPARLADETEGYSVAFLKELVLQARLAAVRRGEERLSAEDLDLAVACTREHLRLASRGLEDRGNVGF